MNWFKRLALTLSLPLLFAVGEASARTSVFILNYDVSTNGQGTPTATFNPPGSSCSLGLFSNCTVDVQAGQTLSISIGLPTGQVVTGWSGLCAAAGTATSATITIPANSGSAPTCGVVVRSVAPPTPQTGWWWAPGEGGSGYALAVNGNDSMFIAFFGYRDNGQPLWRVATAPRVTTAPSARAYRGTLQEMAGGGTLAGGERGNAQPVNSSVELTANFTSATAGRLTLRNAATGQSETKLIQRYPISGSTVQPSPDNAIWTGWYWDSNQPGVGYFIEQQGNAAFIGAFAYDTTGAPIWYVSSGTVLPTGAGYQLQAPLNSYTGGSPFGARPPVNPPTPVSAGSLTANLARAGLTLQLSTGRGIVPGFYNW
ncbi:MAG: hypothetical protein ACT7A5_09770 [Ferrovibrionaceae bacterium]